MKFNLANIFTSSNLFCGCIATVMIFRNHLDIAAYLVLLAAFFDLLDGMVARKISAGSDFGKQLDSLADVISFGLVPGAIMFKLLQQSISGSVFPVELTRVLQFFPFIITVFSALRLAKFNIDNRQSVSFIGLPTPANTLFIISLPMILKQVPGKFDSIVLNPYFIIIISVLSSYMLIAELPLFSMKFANSKFKENIYQYSLLIMALVLIPIFLFAAIPLLIILYIFLSVIQNSVNKKKLL